MSKQIINIGTANNAGDGDELRSAFDKTNDNFTDLYEQVNELNEQSGHASYADTLYPDNVTFFTVSANTDTILPNNAGTIYDSEKPSGVDSFYYSGSLELSNITGAFVLDEVITGGTSGKTANIAFIGVDFIYLKNNDGVFTVSETITGGTSGATATVDVLGDGFITGRNNDNLDLMIYFKAEPSNATQWMDIWIDIGGSVGELYRETVSFPKGSGVERGVLYPLPSAYTRDTWESNNGTIYVRSNHSLKIYGLNFNFDRSYKNKS